MLVAGDPKFVCRMRIVAKKVKECCDGHISCTCNIVESMMNYVTSTLHFKHTGRNFAQLGYFSQWFKKSEFNHNLRRRFGEIMKLLLVVLIKISKSCAIEMVIIGMTS